MVLNELTKSIRELCADAVKNFRLPTEGGNELRAPQIFNGFLPPKRSGSKDDFPFVLVRPISCEMNRGSQEIRVVIFVGCFSEEFDGYEYCVNVCERICEKIATLPDETLNKKYQMSYPIRWTEPEEQPYPQWQFEIETTWVYNSPMNHDDF